MNTNRRSASALLVFVMAVALAMAGPAGTAQAATTPFPCTNIKLDHQWERSCKGTTSRTGSKVSGIAYRIYQSRELPGLGPMAEIVVDLTDTQADGSCAWLRIDTDAIGRIWRASCDNGHTERLDWIESGMAGGWARAYVCTSKNTTPCTLFWSQNLLSAGPAGTF